MLARPVTRLAGRLLDGVIFLIVAGIVLSRAGVTSTASLTEPVYSRSVQIADVLDVTYELLLIALLGQTVGCLVVGVKVVRAEDLAVPGLWRALRRVVVVDLAGLVPVIGFVLLVVVFAWMLWDPRRQGLHDKAAGTIVIDLRPERRYGARSGRGQPPGSLPGSR